MRIVAPARLHLGFLDLEGSLGRRFGSLGLTLDGIATMLTVSRAGGGADLLPDRQTARIAGHLAALRHRLPVPPVEIVIEQAIPAHVGLGSGTQLGLALGVAATRLVGRHAEPREVAPLLERGARSGIGVGAFTSGGVLLDGGRGSAGSPPPIVGRVEFPETWRVLLVMDGARHGLSGAAERQAFADLPRFPGELAGRLCRLAVMAFLPAIADGDLQGAAAALGEIQRRVGDHFAEAQGGRFTSPLVADALQQLERRGILGVGQSSWGPTGFALLPDQDAAEWAAGQLAASHPGLALRIVCGRNRGADVAWQANGLSDAPAERA